MKWKLLSIFVALSFVLVACGTTNQEGMNNDGDGNIQPTRYNDDLNNNRNNVRDSQDGMNDNRMDNRRGDRNGDMNNNRNDRNNMRNNKNNDRYDVSKDAAQKITDEVDEIDHAYVLTTKNNAYVAAAFDADDNDNNTGNNNRNRNNNQKGTDRNNADRNGMDNNKGTDRTRNNATDRDNNNNMDSNDDRLTDDVKNEISEIVKSTDNDIDNVYVSTNPDFMDLTTNYVNDMDNGNPVRGFFDQMGDMVKRLFPQNK